MFHVNQLIGFGAGGKVPFEFVGGAITTKAGATSGNSTMSLTSGLTGGISASAQSGDLVIAVFGSAHTTTLSITDGTNNYTQIGSEVVSSPGFRTRLRCAYKQITDDTSVTFGPTGSTYNGGVTSVQVWRGASAATPMDVSATQATGTNSHRANPPSITPVTVGATVLAVGLGNYSDSESRLSYTHSGLTDLFSACTSGGDPLVMGVGQIVDWVSGAVDPAAFSHAVATDALYAWSAMTIAIRPA